MIFHSSYLDRNNLRVLFGDGNGAFEPKQLEARWVSTGILVAGDFDKDRDVDIASEDMFFSMTLAWLQGILMVTVLKTILLAAPSDVIYHFCMRIH